MAVDPQFAPFALRDIKGKTVGFDVDLARAIAEKMGVPLEAQNITFSGLVDAVKNKRADLAASGIQPVTRAGISYSDVYFDNAQVFAVRSGNPTKFVFDTKQIVGKIVGVRANTIGFLAAFQKLVPLGVKIKVFDTNQKALEELQAKKVEALIMDLPSLEALQAKKAAVERSDKAVLTEERYAFAVPSNSDMLPFLNRAIAEWKEKGGYSKALEKWLLDR